MDLGIEVILELFSKEGISKIFESASNIETDNSQRIFALKEEYIKTINDVIAFLQNKKPTLARQICSMNFLPEASRFSQLDDMEYAFGNMGLQDKAKHLATLYLEDLSDFIVENIDENFGFSRYAEKLGRSANSFDELYEKLHSEKTFIDEITLELLEKKIKEILFLGDSHIQARLAYDHHLAFFNLFQTMGGENSIVNWANQKPALANKDYVHPNAKGADILAEKLFHAIMNDYHNYKPKTETAE